MPRPGYSAAKQSCNVKILADWNRDGLVEELPTPLPHAKHFVIALPLPHLPADLPSEDTAWPQLGRIHPAEIGKVVVQVEIPLPTDSALMLRVDKAAMGRVSLFQQREGQWTLLGADGTWKVDLEPGRRPHAILGVVAHSFAQADWSGDFAVTVALVAGDGVECGTSELHFRVAPFLLASARRILVPVFVSFSPAHRWPESYLRRQSLKVVPTRWHLPATKVK
jgi:hypothetical protein